MQHKICKSNFDSKFLTKYDDSVTERFCSLDILILIKSFNSKL